MCKSGWQKCQPFLMVYNTDKNYTNMSKTSIGRNEKGK